MADQRCMRLSCSVALKLSAALLAVSLLRGLNDFFFKFYDFCLQCICNFISILKGVFLLLTLSAMFVLSFVLMSTH